MQKWSDASRFHQRCLAPSPAFPPNLSHQPLASSLSHVYTCHFLIWHAVFKMLIQHPKYVAIDHIREQYEFKNNSSWQSCYFVKKYYNGWNAHLLSKKRGFGGICLFLCILKKLKNPRKFQSPQIFVFLWTSWNLHTIHLS